MSTDSLIMQEDFLQSWDSTRLTDHMSVSSVNMGVAESDSPIVKQDDLILVTGATGFIGSKLVGSLLDRGFRNLRCFARPSSDMAAIEALLGRRREGARVEVVKGNLGSKEDCVVATRDVAVIYHLAAGRGEKFFADAFFNSVVTTRNLLEASINHQ